MKLIQTISLEDVKISIFDLGMKYPQFTFVVSQGVLKIYKQVR